jgi:hypothetical protein
MNGLASGVNVILADQLHGCVSPDRRSGQSALLLSTGEYTDLRRLAINKSTDWKLNVQQNHPCR